MSAISVSEWFSPEGLRALVGACTLLGSVAGYFGWDAHEAAQEAEATRTQVTHVVNHIYQQCE